MNNRRRNWFRGKKEVEESKSLIFTYEIPANGTLQLPLSNFVNNYNFIVRWGDGTSDVITVWNQSEATKTYINAGTYTVELDGFVPRLFSRPGANYLKSIDSWGDADYHGLNILLSAFRDAVNLVSVCDGDGTRNVGSFSQCFANCSSLFNLGMFNTISGTDFGGFLLNCISIVDIPIFNTSNGTNFGNLFNGMFQNCSAVIQFPLIDTSKGTSFHSMYRSCRASSYPLLNTSNGFEFSYMYQGTVGCIEYPLIDTSKGTIFQFMYDSTSNINNVSRIFPLIDTSLGVNFISMYSNNRFQDSFPLINTQNGTNFTSMYRNAIETTSFPLIDTSKGVVFGGQFGGMYYDCRSATQFPEIDTGNATNLTYLYARTFSATSYPTLNTSKCTVFWYMYWQSNASSFPLIDTGMGQNFFGMYLQCNQALSFPLINTVNGTNFRSMYNGTTNATSYPLINTSNGNLFGSMYGSTFASVLPTLDTSSATEVSTGRFGGMYSLARCIELPLINTSACVQFRDFCSQNGFLLRVPSLDFSSGTSFLAILTSSNNVEEFHAFGIRYSIDLKNKKLDYSNLLIFFNNLGTAFDSNQLIEVSGNPGVSSLTQTDKNIVLNKGFQLDV